MRFPVGVLLLLGACAHSPQPRLQDEAPLRAHVGKVLAVSNDNIKLERDGWISQIGFVANADVRPELDKVKVGDEVLALFGSTRTPHRPRPINDLRSIRGCAPVDPECALARQAQAAKDEARAKASAASAAAQDRCDQAMLVTLASDPRYVAPPAADAPSPGDPYARFNALAGKQKACANAFIRDHKQAVFEACEAHRCGDSIGGGCAHIVGQSGNPSAFEKAAAKCGN